MAESKEYKGYNGTLTLTDTGVIIKRKKGFLLGGGKLRGEKTIPYSNIIAVQLKKAGWTGGYLQLTLAGGSGGKGGLFRSTMDANTVCFYKSKNQNFEEAKEIIERHISGGSQKATSNLDELERLASLKEKGIITQDEFDAKKKSLLNL
jgi:hypothetical protein